MGLLETLGLKRRTPPPVGDDLERGDRADEESAWQRWLLRGGLGLGVFALGTVHIVRSIGTFGIDNAALVSLYYPEESAMEDHAIYSVMRHPIYTGWLLWMAGGTLFGLSLYGFLEFGVFFAALVVWLRRVEEPELVDRFGESYREYRREVPAFVPRPDSAGAYVAFLLGRD